MNRLLPLCIILIACFTSCKKAESNTNTINGVWESIGSGWVLNIQDSLTYELYDMTSISCLSSRKADLDELIDVIALREDTLELLRGVMSYKFTRIDNLPEPCTNQVYKLNSDPVYNFEVFAETVKEHYAFFELNNINWPALYEQQRNKISKNSSTIELYSVIEETLELLNDNHAYLEATDDVYQAMELQEQERLVLEDEETLPEYGDFEIANLVTKHYLIEDLTKDSWLINWGLMDDNIGFIQIKAMWLYADLDIPQTLIEEVGFVDAYVETFHKMDEGQYIEQERQGISHIMRNVMTDLSETRAIIIDTRFNGGGQDAVSFEILKHFNNQPRHIVTSKLRYGNNFSPDLKLQLEDVKEAYTKPVFVLTSPQTGSAAESFAIGTMALPHVSRIGARTQGALSTALEKSLPNGWAFSISNEIYMDANGNSYENIGVPVDFKLDYPKDRQTFFRYIANNLEKDKLEILLFVSKSLEGNK